MGERFMAGHAAAMAIAIAKTQEASEIAHRRQHITRQKERGGLDMWLESTRNQRRAATREKKEFRLKGLRP